MILKPLSGKEKRNNGFCHRYFINMNPVKMNNKNITFLNRNFELHKFCANIIILLKM